MRDPANPKRRFVRWIITARTAKGHFAHMNFRFQRPSNQNDPDLQRHDPAPERFNTFVITDRPVYRPGATVQFKFWVAHDRLNEKDAAELAGKTFTVQITNPRRDTVFTRSFKADAFGGFDGSFEVPSDAALGVYRVLIPHHGGGRFRVEEYKKPEFEVKVEGPATAGMLGEKVPATIKANYYFGGPVAEARVKYKITRRADDAGRGYPAARWDWLFGPGYGWFAAESSWYPGWSRWGMPRPRSWSRNDYYYGEPDKLEAEAELPIRPDGTLPIEIDTAIARLADPDRDHRFEITAEITDASRRTVVGTGVVRVGRKPFTVCTSVDRGYYRAGDPIEARVQAQTADRKPVAGKGTLRLLEIAYDAERRPVEMLVEKRDLTLDSEGHARQVLKASAPGQYRTLGDDRRRQGPRDRRGLSAHHHRGRIRQCESAASMTWRSSPSVRSTGPARRSGS